MKSLLIVWSLPSSWWWRLCRNYHPFYEQNGWKSFKIECGLFVINNSAFTRHVVHDLPSPLLLLCNSSLPSSPFINLPSAGRTRQVGRAFVSYGDTVESLNTVILQDRLKCLSYRGVRLIRGFSKFSYNCVSDSSNTTWCQIKFLDSLDWLYTLV